MIGDVSVARELDRIRKAYAEALPVSQRTKPVVEVLVGMPLATPSRLAAARKLTPADLHGPLTELRGKGFVSSDNLTGAAPGSKPAPRLFFTEKAIQMFGALPMTWHQEGNRCSLLDRLPVVDGCYRAATEIDFLGQFVEFRWLDDVALDAIARYEYGWVGLIWSGMLETTAELDARFEQLVHDVHSLAIGPDPRPWPGSLAVVVPDPWQRDLVLQAARTYPFARTMGVWTISDGSRIGPAEKGASRGWIHQEVEPRDTVNWLWDDRIEASIWSQRLAPSVYRTARTIAKYSGITRPVLRRTMGENPQGTRTKQCVQMLIRLDLVEAVSERDLKEGDQSASAIKRWLRLSRRGIDSLARMERGTFAAYRDRAVGQSWLNMPKRKDHEEGVFNLLADFRREGLDVAPGWRYYDGMGRRGAVAPDGMVLPNQSIFGPTWHFIEYERSARSPSQVGPKLKNYVLEARRMGLPLLVVCWNDTAEKNFHAEGMRIGAQMLTTIIPRLKQHGPLHNFDCWLHYGQRVRIG